MTYTEVVFTLTSHQDYHSDLLINELAEAGFDTFEETESGFKAYVLSSNFNEVSLKDIIESFKDEFSVSYEVNQVEQQNWNQVWESNFSPITIGDQCYIRATFHDPQPGYPYEIVIDPKMAFGTGHHQTTAMVIELMLEEDFKNKTVLDMGCGTGILAILAGKLGATDISAIDYDAVCYESTQENASLNNVSRITAICGSAESIPNKTFDVVLANINRNILLQQISKYAFALKEGGILIISGFYKEDLQQLDEAARVHNLTFNKSKTLDNWVAALFVKKNVA